MYLDYKGDACEKEKRVSGLDAFGEGCGEQLDKAAAEGSRLKVVPGNQGATAKEVC